MVLETQGRSLAQRLAAAPHLCAPEAARTRVEDWLSEIAAAPAGRMLRRLIADHPMLGRLLAGLADGSPHLWELARADADRLVGLLESEPRHRFDGILESRMASVAATSDEAEVIRLLRRMKAEASLLIALADLGGVWPVTQVIALQTALADAAVGAAVDYLIADAQRRERLAIVEAHPARSSGYIVLAMGKMGAGELNYSSDIDLIVFYDSAALAVGVEPAPFFVRITRTLVKLLQQRTVDGYVFRTDLRLRPDPASTQIAISTTAAFDYYESRGQNWERAALIKARPCAGDIGAGERLLAGLSPFIWRKYLDFAAVADVHAMKRQIHAYRGHDEIAVEGHNIKLGRGGIREIEFFVQTQQLIAGGRHPQLRTRETLQTLSILAEGGWIDEAARDDLAAAYRFLRVVENRLQMVADEQTHTLPADRDGLERFARFAGFADRDAFAEALLAHLRRVQHHYATLFEHAPALEAGRRSLTFPPATDDRETLDRLTEMGFRQPLEVSTLVRHWHGGAYPSLKGAFARAQLAEIVPVLLHHFARSANPDGAVIAFDRFLAGLHGGGRLFSLLRQNPDLVALIALVLGAAPRLADGLAHFPEVMDAVIDPSFFGALPEDAELAAGLERSLLQAASYEDFLDRVRIFAQEQMFLIGTRILSGTASAEQAGETFARLADVLIRSLHRSIEESFARQHGRVAGQQTAILALGKLGGREMTAASDLDLIVVYDFDREHPEFGRSAPALRGAIFLAADPALDQCAHGSDQPWAPVPGRYAAAAIGPLWSACRRDRRICRLSGKRSLDLGTHGAHPRAGGVGLAGIRRARRGGDPRRIVQTARCTDDRGRRGRDAGCDRQGEGRQRALESQVCRRRPDRHRIRCAIPAARFMPRRARKFSIPRLRVSSTRHGAWVCWRRTTRRSCGRPCGSITI